MTYSVEQLDLNHQDLMSLFNVRFCRDERDIESSVKNFGILVPPRVLRFASGALRVVDGMARIEALRSLGESHVECLVYEENQLDLKNAFLMCLELNSWNREFNVVEQAYCLKAASELYGGMNIPKTVFQYLGMKKNIRAINQYKDLLKLPERVLKYMVHNDIRMSVALGFLKFPKDDINPIATQLFMLPINQNKLSEILGLLADLYKRDGVAPQMILEEVLAEIGTEFSGSRKEQQIRKLLHKRRNPSYEGQLSKFEEKTATLGLPKHAQVNPAPFFEDDYIELTVKLHSHGDIRKLLESLNQDEWHQFWDEGSKP